MSSQFLSLYASLEVASRQVRGQCVRAIARGPSASVARLLNHTDLAYPTIVPNMRTRGF
jgi:hypothetical protein